MDKMAIARTVVMNAIFRAAYSKADVSQLKLSSFTTVFIVSISAKDIKMDVKQTVIKTYATIDALSSFVDYFEI